VHGGEEVESVEARGLTTKEYMKGGVDKILTYS